MQLEQKAKVLKFEMYLQEYEQIISKRLKEKGIWEPTEGIIARRYIKHGDTVVDVGAHIGYFTLLFSHQTGNTGQVVAFEPDPQNFNLLRKNVEHNELDNVTLVSIAVSNVDSGPVKLYQTGAVTGHHSLVEVPETTDSIDVQVRKLDSWFAVGDKVDFVKIDVEGAEGLVLMGMNRLIDQNPQIKLMVEFSADNFENFGHTQADIYFLLKEFGFNVYMIDMQSKDLILIEPEELDWFIEQKEHALSYRNIFAMRS